MIMLKMTKLPQSPLHVRSFDAVLTLEASSAWPVEFKVNSNLLIHFLLG